jgi:tetratricopeptide (TPR) repeat protein
MTKAPRRDPRKTFVPRFLPWLLAGLMLVIYGLTLNHWVSLFNLDHVARISGWTWQPPVMYPVTCLVTWPFRWLPVVQIPLALNVFSAVLASAVLGLLARSVALLPQDRTEAQRLRETSDFSFLTIRGAWLPPVLAVLTCGLQFTFWEFATNFTGDLVDLLIFALMIWSLLEYRLDEREGRLFLAAGIYGAGMTQDYGLIGFLPFLLAAMIGIRGLGFFNAAFLARFLGCGLAGLSLYFMLPTLDVLSGKLPASLWWQAFWYNLSSQWGTIIVFFENDHFRHALALICLTSLLPVLMMSVRWRAAFGDRSRIGTQVTGIMIHVVYAVMLGICLWGAFDPPFSPRHLGFGLPCLTFYYLAALSMGYFSGYFLLVFRRLPTRNSRRDRPPVLLAALQPVALAVIALLAVAVTAGLVWKNRLPILSINNSGLKTYARMVAASLPHAGGILLADSETAVTDTPRRLYFVQEALAEAGRAGEYVPVDTQALSSPQYHQFLHKKYPRQWPLLVDPKNNNLLNPHGLLGLMELLAKTNTIYYLNPSFGYYFEAFYLEPHGLIYQMKNLPQDTLLPRLPDARLQAENEAFWNRAEQEAFAPILKETTPPDAFANRHELGQRIKARLHVTPEINFNDLLTGEYYSRSLDFWGVLVQRARALLPAAAHFEMAQKLNPDNVVAGINLAFNQDLRTGRPAVLDLAKTGPDQWGKYHSWEEVQTACGPYDEPSFCFNDGSCYMQGSLLCQAIASFTRVHDFLPDNLPALVALGELYVFSHRPQLALDALREPLAHPDRFGLNETNSTEVNLVASAAYLQQTNLARGIHLLDEEVNHHPDDTALLTAATQAYVSQGLWTNALRVINVKLALTPDDPTWLFGQGFALIQLKQYPAAIASLTRTLELQTNNYDALFKRAVVYLDTGDLPAARSDYLRLQQANPKSFQVAYGLGEIAWRQRDTNVAVQYYSVYLDNAPTNSAEFKLIRERFARLTGKSP